MIDREVPDDVQCDMCKVPYPHLHIRPMEEVLEFNSSDAPAWGGYAVKHTLEGKFDDPQVVILEQLIIEEGFRMGYAPSYYDRCIYDGHHRIVTLWAMGAKWCPIQRSETHARDSKRFRELQNQAYLRRRKVYA